MKFTLSLRTIVPLVVLTLCIVALVPIVATGSVMIGNLVLFTLIYAALASSWNIVGGFAGQLSLGHAGFFGLGAYASSLLYLNWSISPWIGLIIAILAGALVGFLIGLPTFRLRGAYYALATLALGIILYEIAIHFGDLTQGHRGLSLPPNPSLANMTFFDRWPYVIIIGGYLIVCVVVAVWISSTRLGFQLAAVREDEDAARALGVNTTRVKLIAGTISAGLAAGVGTLYAQYMLFITPDSVLGVMVSIEIIVLAIVGGSGRVYGPLLGALLLVPASQMILREFGGALPGLHLLIYGVVVVVVILVFPRGLAGLWGSVQRRLTRKRVRA